MKYRVIVRPRAQRDIGRAYLFFQRKPPRAAASWFNGLDKAIASLGAHPQRCSLAPETDVFIEEIRQLLYGKRRNIWRILFVIRGRTVSILCVRHAGRTLLAEGELDLSDLD